MTKTIITCNDPVHTRQKLIYTLLSIPSLNNAKVQMLLASYPSAISIANRSQIILELLKILVDTKFNFDPYNDFDFVLALTKKRGHFVHQFEVLLFGLNIICLNMSEILSLYKDTPLADPDKIIKTWIMTAIAHDFGYPVEGANDISAAIGTLYRNIGLKNAYTVFKSMDIKKIILEDDEITTVQVEGNKIDFSNFIKESLIAYIDESDKINELIKSLHRDFNHGYASSLLALRLIFSDLLQRYKFDELILSWEYYSLRQSVGAITLHAIDFSVPNNNEILLAADFNKNIFSKILYIVDNLQDWDRTIFLDNQYADFLINDVKFEAGNVYLEYLLVHDKWDKEVLAKCNKFLEKKKRALQDINTNVLQIKINVRYVSNDSSVDYHLPEILL